VVQEQISSLLMKVSLLLFLYLKTNKLVLAAHIDPNLFYKTILPILQMKNTALLALSSPEGSDNYYSQLMQLEDEHGRPFFRTVDCFMICKSCRKLERDKQILCNHVKQTAHWLSARKGQRLKSLYKHDPSTAIREFGGISIDGFTPCFRPEDVALLYDAPPVVLNYTPDYVYVAVDPNGGGPSQMAIVSLYFDTNGRCIVSYFIVYSFDASFINSLMVPTIFDLWYAKLSVLSIYSSILHMNLLN